MSVPYAPAASVSAPHRGMVWVFGGTVALLAIAAWLTILLHLVLIVRAEVRLFKITAQAERFSQLPDVDARELTEYVQRRLIDAGFRTARVKVVRDSSRPGRPVVATIETTSSDVGPHALRGLWSWIGAQPMVVGANVRPSAPLFSAG